MPRDIPIGNGSLMVLYDKKGLVRDLFFPSVGSATPKVTSSGLESG